MQPKDNLNSEPSADGSQSGTPPESSDSAFGSSSSEPNPSVSQSPQTASFGQASVTSSMGSSALSAPKKSFLPAGGGKKKLLLGGIIAAVILLGGGAAAYLGVMAPNKPENIWKKSLENTGKGYDRLVNYAEEKKDIKGAKVKGNFKIEAADVVADGTIDSKADEKNSETKITLGAVGTRFELEMLTNIPDGAKNPDIYAKVSGLKGVDKLLGAEGGGVGESLAAFDNQWYFVDHTLLDQAEKSASDHPASSITGEDVAALARDIGEVSKEYVFTDDPGKAVLVVKENVGKETLDGRSVYHFKVGVNKANLKDYNKAMCDKVLNNKLYKSLSFGVSSEQLKTECYDTKSIDSINESNTVDVYADMKTKLIRIVRIAEKDKKDNYFDFGVLYNGGDEYPFVIRGQAKGEGGEGKGELKMTLNSKTDNITVTGNIDGKSEGATYKFTTNMTIEPSKDKVEFKKPEGAKSLIEAYGALLGGFGGGIPGAPASGGGASPDPALINRCISATAATMPPECEALFNEQ